MKDTDSYACGKKDVKLGQRLLSGGDTALLVFTRKKAFPDLSSKLVPHLENGSRRKTGRMALSVCIGGAEPQINSLE